MKKTKKFVSILLALVLTVSSFSILSAVTASAATDTKVYVEIPDSHLRRLTSQRNHICNKT